MSRFWAVILWMLCCNAPGAAQELQRYEFRHPQMGTWFRLVFYAGIDSSGAAQIAGKVFDRIDTLNGMFSDWLPESELNRLCRTAGADSSVAVSAELFDILSKAQKCSQKSRGAFDVTVGPLTRLWRRSRTLKELPDSVRLEDARSKTGWQELELIRSRGRVKLNKPGMALDLGGIAQGWTADHCLVMLKEMGIRQSMVDAGGDIALGDPPPDARGWTIEIPSDTDKKLQLILHNCGITTSGATYRYLEVDGVRYSHIVDPRTGMALTHRILVTVLAADATTADAWATAISVLGRPGWQKTGRIRGVRQVWLTETPL